MTDATRVVLEETGPVARLRLARPEASNALDLDMIRALDDAWTRLEAAPDVRVVVLLGEGRSFCGGADLAWLRAVDEGRPDEWMEAYEALDRMLIRFAQFNKPVICHLSGAVVGAGLAMAAASDVVVADKRCRFMLPELQLGMVPTVVVPVLVARIGRAALRRACLGEAQFDAARAVEIGLADYVVLGPEADARVDAIVEVLLSNAPNATRAFKRLLADLPEGPLSDQMRFVRQFAVDGLESEEMRRGIRATLDRRVPDWIGGV